MLLGVRESGEISCSAACYDSQFCCDSRFAPAEQCICIDSGVASNALIRKPCAQSVSEGSCCNFLFLGESYVDTVNRASIVALGCFRAVNARRGR